MNFYKDLQLDYENKALKWSVNFQGPEFDIPEKLKEDVALIGDMCKVSWNHSNDSHQCPILPADFVIFYYGTENEEAIQAGARSE